MVCWAWIPSGFPRGCGMYIQEMFRVVESNGAFIRELGAPRVNEDRPGWPIGAVSAVDYLNRRKGMGDIRTWGRAASANGEPLYVEGAAVYALYDACLDDVLLLAIRES